MSIRYNRDVNPTTDGARASGPLSRQRLKTLILHYAAAIAAIAVLVAVFSRLPVVPTTVALSFLLVVLIVASRWGIAIAITTAVVATLAFNYYFLPPLR